MKRSITNWQVAGFLFTSIFGTFLHFLFDLSGHSAIVAVFSAVNESIWEHLKLIYYPMVIFAVIEWRSIGGKECRCFWNVKMVGIVFGLLIIPVSYYTYTGILGFSSDLLNIILFYIAVGTAYWIEEQILKNGRTYMFRSTVSITVIFAIGMLFAVWTFFPPHLPLFTDPIRGTFGFLKESQS